MGGSYDIPAAEPMSQVLQDYSKYLPGLMSQMSGLTPTTAYNNLQSINQMYNPDPNISGASGAQDQSMADIINQQNQFMSQLATQANGGTGTSTTAQHQNSLGDLLFGGRAGANTTTAVPNITAPTIKVPSGTAASGSTPLGLNALNLQQLQKYALPEAQVGQEIARSNALAGANTNLAQIKGPGGDAARAASSLEDELDPSRRAAKNLLSSINLDGLSPGEASSVERSLNQTNTSSGNLGLANPTNTITNALNFGGAFNNKLGLANTLTNTANSVFSRFSPTGVALGQPSGSTGSNFGAGQFTGANSNTASASNSNAFNFGGGLLSNMTSTNNAAIGGNTTLGAANSIPSYLGAVCCFIFLEAYYGRIPKCVRKGRDKYYNVNPFIAVGYRRMASWLVPMMQCNSFIRWFVWTFMVNPITNHLHSPKRNINKRITHFWLRIWAMLGNNKCEADYCELINYRRIYV